MSNNSDNYTGLEDLLDRKLGVFVEHMNDRFDRVLEAVGEMQENVAKIPKMAEDIVELKGDVKTIKAAVKETNSDLHNLEVRVDNLEAAA